MSRVPYTQAQYDAIMNKKVAIPLKPNAKIKGAVKSVVGGVKFDSNIEKYMYGLLKGAGIAFEFQKEYLLQTGFRYNGEAVRAITLTVDFFLPDKNMIIDTKGHQTQQGAIRWKMLKHTLYWQVNGPVTGLPPVLPKIEMPRTHEECGLLLNRLLFDNI